jgi:N-acetylglucosamine repressor
MRAMNRSTILNVVKTNRLIARAEVARQTGLSPATVTAIVSDLIAEDLVFEKEIGDSSGGRRPIMLGINPEGGFVAGIKLTEEGIVGALTDLEARVLTKRTDRLESRSAEDVVVSLVHMVRELLAQAQLPQSKLLGVGIGLAGIVDEQRSVLRCSPFFGWRDLPLREMIQQKLNVPVYVDNDVNTLTQAEKWFGSGQGVDNFLVITVGRGIGLGIVINGQLYRGSRGGAGEFGHTIIQPGGRACSCGKQGCLETMVSEPGLVCSALEAAQAGKIAPVGSVDELLQIAQAGNETAAEIFTNAGRLLGQAIGNLVTLFNPEKIILGGEGVRLGALLLAPMQDAIRESSYPLLYSDLTFQIEAWGDDAWAWGAASQVLRELFESPVYHKIAH